MDPILVRYVDSLGSIYPVHPISFCISPVQLCNLEISSTKPQLKTLYSLHSSHPRTRDGPQILGVGVASKRIQPFSINVDSQILSFELGPQFRLSEWLWGNNTQLCLVSSIKPSYHDERGTSTTADPNDQ
jgi:hypothetical protein